MFLGPLPPGGKARGAPDLKLTTNAETLGILDQPIHGVVQPILIPPHQFAEGGRVPIQTPSNQALVVGAHDRRSLIGRGQGREGSRKPLFIVPQVGEIVKVIGPLDLVAGTR